MLLAFLIVLLLTGGIAAGFLARLNHAACRWFALITVTSAFAIIMWIWIDEGLSMTLTDSWLRDLYISWIPSFGIAFHLAMDGLSLLMLALTFFLGILAILVSWKEIQYRVGFFHFNLLWVLAGITGVFLTMDLFLFYFFWEVMLIPMYFLIGIWGHENRQYAAYKFFIFTQASGLLMLLSILALYFIHGEQTGIYSFDYFAVLGTTLSPETGRWLMFGFLIAFIVKLPVVPLHTWLPDAHTEAPTAGSLLLAGLLLKTGAYGLIRFVLPIFPQASASIAPVAMLLGVVGIIYGAMQAYSQTDFKRLVAYTSVSHMGFIMLGVFAFNELAMQGVVMQMITHGISTGALFVIAGVLYERIHTRDILRMGGMWKKVPFMGTVAMVFVMASLGLPGLGNFIAEFMTLVGAWQANQLLTILATAGLVFATAYSLRIMQKVFLGKNIEGHSMTDLSLREKFILVPLCVVIIWLGLFPQQVINTARPAVANSMHAKNHAAIHRDTQNDQEKYTSVFTVEKGGSHEHE
jgi:NADH-quinone oxidoreductase subunit M